MTPSARFTSAPSGVGGTRLARPNGKIAHRLVAYLAVSLAVGVCVYLLANTACDAWIERFLSGDDVRNARLEQNAQSLQRYVTDNHIFFKDKEGLDEWVSAERYVMLQIYADGMIVYDSSINMDISSLGIAGRDAVQWQKTYTIAFPNGEGLAMFYEYYSMRDEMVGTGISIALGITAFIVAFLLLLRRITRYIRLLSSELHLLEGGELDHEVTVRGTDELADLARSVDDMRKAMAHRFENEERLLASKYELVTEMSHDLRSPLTSLIGYLDILYMGKCHDAEDERRYLENSRDKAYRIKEISDDLFEYFTSAEDGLTAPRRSLKCCGELLDGLLASGVFELESVGFSVELRRCPLDPEDVVLVDEPSLQRAFGNLFSNIVRHADRDEPIIVECVRDGETIRITMSNSIADDEMADGPGIGLRTAKRLFEANGWAFAYKSVDRAFSATIELSPPQWPRGIGASNGKAR